MRFLALTLIAACGATVVCAADVVDSQEARVAAAKRYFEVSDFQHLLEESIRAGAASQDPKRADEVVQAVMRHLHTDVLAHIMLNAMVKNFTADELNALADFYGSPAGKSAMAKFPKYMADAMPPVMAEVQRTAKEILAEAKAKREAGTGT